MSSLTSIDNICRAIGIDPLAHGLQILRAADLIPNRAHWPEATAPADQAWSEIQGRGPYLTLLQPYPLIATRPAILADMAASSPAALAQSLGRRYPPSHPLTLASADGEPLWRGSLADLPAQQPPPGSALYLAPLALLDDRWSADGPTTIIARLLGPKGCPWDREQTHRSLRKDLLGETHEVLEAIDQGQTDELAEELGDLLLQILLHAEIGRQAGEFSLDDVYHHLATKLIRRHPHVFGDETAETSTEVLKAWDVIKQAERQEQGKAARGTLDGVPETLPALALAQDTVKKAAKAGFEADSIVWEIDKIYEEMSEVNEAINQQPDIRSPSDMHEELGDLLLIISKLAHRLKIDAESALREATAKFRRRFLAMEALAESRGLRLKALSDEEKLQLWAEVKHS